MSVARQVFHQIYVARAEAMGCAVAEPDLLKTKTTTNGSKATANYGASNVGHIAQVSVTGGSTAVANEVRSPTRRGRGLRRRL